MEKTIDQHIAYRELRKPIIEKRRVIHNAYKKEINELDKKLSELSVTYFIGK